LDRKFVSSDSILLILGCIRISEEDLLLTSLLLDQEELS